MKGIVTVILLCILRIGFAQITLTPLTGINSPRMDNGYMYTKGGNYGLVGMEVEFRRKPKIHSVFYFSVVSGATYLSNGFYESDNFALSSLFYTRRIMHLQTRYIQVPLEVKLNWQPFPLVEDWKVFFGLGISNDFLLRATLEEQSTALTLPSDQPPPPPTTEQYEDSRDIKDLYPARVLFARTEAGMNIRRIHFAWRLSFSLTDMYPAGLEETWKVPDEDSPLIRKHQDTGKIKMKYVELVIGYRLFNN
jgi:hypothetical protein